MDGSSNLPAWEIHFAPLFHRDLALIPFSNLPRHKLLDLISECTGETIWPVDHCRERGLPPDWIEGLADAFESDLGRDRDTIYFHERPTNQFHGVRDVDLAKVIAGQLQLPVQQIEEASFSRSDFVRRIHEAIEEG